LFFTLALVERTHDDGRGSFTGVVGNPWGPISWTVVAVVEAVASVAVAVNRGAICWSLLDRRGGRSLGHDRRRGRGNMSRGQLRLAFILLGQESLGGFLHALLHQRMRNPPGVKVSMIEEEAEVAGRQLVEHQRFLGFADARRGREVSNDARIEPRI